PRSPPVGESKECRRYKARASILATMSRENGRSLGRLWRSIGGRGLSMIDAKEFTAPVVMLYHPTSRRKAALVLAHGFRDERNDGWGRGVYLGGTTSESHHQEVLIVALQVAPEDLRPYALVPDSPDH